MPSRLNAFAAKTTNVSRVIAKIAGIESIANITSNAATITSADAAGVARRRDAPQRAHRERLLRVDRARRRGGRSSPP